ncbi:LacI family DNA-binding transcriptional regulator [Sulfitobacter sp. F26204]|uniref:LacI family DNA-binding transcriptional regulator n=1 Tax=Sulfitobacter sp. F26204 TaxID=2996014 RepID=UPI00225E3504|nr:LacI family DNA-binding transcriptional regulator [Sulfitobacter sp. F26204]MCX7560989.1 LacI family DNA-binding transcriptional regulator [Sulfitobacter sp. F26204]
MTIKQIADELGVHPSTVSRALNPATRGLIGKATTERIEQAAKKLGYYPNAAAASLRTGRSKLIGVFLPDITNPVFSPVLSSIAEVISGAGFATIVADVGNDGRNQSKMMFELVARRVEGLILATVSRNDSLVQQCISEGLPVVLVNRAESKMRVSSVTSDDAYGMRLAIEHLHALGHRRIGHLAGPQNLSTGYLRNKGFHDAVTSLDFDPADTPVVECSAYTRQAGAAAMKSLLEQNADITAVAASNDLVALGAYGALQDAGLKVPDDISVVGHNDMPLVDMVSPPLTTIRISHRELGREAARLLMSEINQEGSGRRSIVLAPELVVRNSTRQI